MVQTGVCNNSMNHYLCGSFWMECLSDDERTVDTKCERVSAEGFHFWWHRLLELHKETKRKEKRKWNTITILQNLYPLKGKTIKTIFILNDLIHIALQTFIKKIAISGLKYVQTPPKMRITVCFNLKGIQVKVACLTLYCVFVSYYKRG